MYPEKQFRRNLPEWHKAGAGGPPGAESTDWLSSSPSSTFLPPAQLIPSSPPSVSGGPSSSTHPQTHWAPFLYPPFSSQASSPHNCWRAGGDSAGRGAIRNLGDPGGFTAHPPSCSVSTSVKLAQRRITGSRMPPQQGSAAAKSPELVLNHSSSSETRGAILHPRAPQASSSSPEPTGPSLSSPCQSQPVLSSPVPRSWPRQPSFRTTGVSRIHGGGRNTARAIFPTGVRRLTPSQDLTATVSQYSRAPSVASYPAPNPTARSRALRPLLTLPTPAFYKPLDFPKLLLATRPLHTSLANCLLLILYHFFFNLFQYSTENIVNIP